MPKWDANLFLQTDAFEVNNFVGRIMFDLLNYGQDARDVAFSSFDADSCIALQCNQCRYDVLFLCDSDERIDLKDYRAFYT